jgi:hypothetical protein
MIVRRKRGFTVIEYSLISAAILVASASVYLGLFHTR